MAGTPKERDIKTNKMIDRTYASHDREYIIKNNFLFIREIFNVIKDYRTSNIDFWLYLLDWENTPENAEKAEAHFTALIRFGTGNSMKHAKKLIAHGISAEYFNESPAFIIADPAIQYVYDIATEENEAYYDSKKKNESKIYSLQERREVLLENIFTIKNLDGTLVIDCMRNLLMDMYHISEPTYDLGKYLTDLKAGSHLSQKNLKKYYKDVAEKFAKQLTIPALPTGTVSDKKIYTAVDSQKGSFTLFIIRETYAILAAMNGINNYMNNFYEFIDISEDEYQNMIDSEIISNKLLVQKFAPYKYPASLFRGENPTEMDVCRDIKEYYFSYKNNTKFDIEKFRHYLKVYLCYKISNDNFALIIPTCSLIEAMLDTLPYTNFLSDDELKIYKSVQLAEAVSLTDTEN